MMKKRLISILLLLVTLLSVCVPASADSNSSISRDRTFQVLSSVSMNSDGYTVVSWEDSAGNGPYRVTYEYVDLTNFADQWEYVAANDVTVKTFAIRRLIPGKMYWINVYDRNGTRATGALITVPTRGTTSSTRNSKTTLTPVFSQNGGSPKTLNNMSASAMTRNMAKGYSYGMRYSTTFYSKGSKLHVHKALFAFYAPNGFASTEYSDDFTLPREANVEYYYKMLGDSFFDDLYELNGSIPAGKYRFEIYLEGQLFYSKSFTVKE